MAEFGYWDCVVMSIIKILFFELFELRDNIKNVKRDSGPLFDEKSFFCAISKLFEDPRSAKSLAGNQLGSPLIFY